jgi:hypothetical protein
MLTEVERRGSVTDTVNGIQQKVDALIQQVERLDDSPRKRALENALADIRALAGEASRNASAAR